jgi:hypothetical protein
MNQMRVWMQAASKAEQIRLAELSGTTIGTLNQIAGSYRTGGEPAVRSGLAGRIQTAALTIKRKNKLLPAILRTDLSPECRECEYAQRCLKSSAIMGEFMTITDGIDDLV